jgi:enoyl-CoA hydratase/carnithine racemase
MGSDGASGLVAVERHDSGIVEVQLRRADKRNALDAAMFRALARAGASLLDDRSARVIVLTGDGASFCAGLDLAAFATLGAQGTARRFDPHDDGDDMAGPGTLVVDGDTHVAQYVCRVWRLAPVPVVAALHGHALGAGLQIALGADVRIAHPDTQLSLRELHWGIIPDMAGTLHMQGLVRDDVARELVYTARIIDAREGERIGLVTRLADDPRAAALDLAAQIAARNPDAVRAAKVLLSGTSTDATSGAASRHMARERELIASLVNTPNQREAVMASLEKRPARFVDPAR